MAVFNFKKAETEIEKAEFRGFFRGWITAMLIMIMTTLMSSWLSPNKTDISNVGNACMAAYKDAKMCACVRSGYRKQNLFYRMVPFAETYFRSDLESEQMFLGIYENCRAAHGVSG
jgi:hypothetical protein